MRPDCGCCAQPEDMQQFLDELNAAAAGEHSDGSDEVADEEAAASPVARRSEDANGTEQ